MTVSILSRCRKGEVDIRIAFCIFQQIFDATIPIDIVEGRAKDSIETRRLVEGRGSAVVRSIVYEGAMFVEWKS